MGTLFLWVSPALEALRTQHMTKANIDVTMGTFSLFPWTRVFSGVLTRKKMRYDNDTATPVNYLAPR